MASAAVPTSRKNTFSIGQIVSSDPASTGAAIVVPDWSMFEMPFTRVNCSRGTNWGSRAPTAGPCTAWPSARTAAVSITSQSAAPPAMNTQASARVARAIIASDRMMSFSRSIRSAQTPPNGAMRTMGTKPQRMYTVIAQPDRVARVTCHIRAYWTRDEPNSDSAWLVRKSAVVRCQGCAFVVMGGAD